MMYVYKKKIMDGTITGLQYMKKRFLHLYPLMLITFIYVASIQFYNIKTTGICFVYTCTDLLHAVLNVFMINFGIVDTAYNFNGPAWCVPIEMLAYLLLFILIRKSEKRQDKLYLLLAGGIYIATTLICAVLSYELIEKRLVKRIIKKRGDIVATQL